MMQRRAVRSTVLRVAALLCATLLPARAFAGEEPPPARLAPRGQEKAVAPSRVPPRAAPMPSQPDLPPPPPGENAWIEQPREPPVDANDAERLARLAVVGGAGARPLLALAPGPLLSPLADGEGVSAASWLRSISPAPAAHDEELTARLASWMRAAIVLGNVPLPFLVAGTLVATALASTTLASGFVPASNTLPSPALASGVVVLGAVMALAAGWVFSHVISFGAFAAGQGAASIGWRRESGQTTGSGYPGRPLDAKHARRLGATVVRATIDSGDWRGEIPLVGPIWAAASVRTDVVTNVRTARELAGLPRVRDTVQRQVDFLLFTRAALRTTSHVLLLAALSAGALVGALLVGDAARSFAPRLALIGAGLGGASGAVVIALVAALAAGCAHALDAFTPWWIAGSAMETSAEPAQSGGQAVRPSN